MSTDEAQATSTNGTAESADTAGEVLPPKTQHPAPPFTLAIDVGGTGLKASVLDSAGAMVADRVKVPTTYPLPPQKLVDDLVKLVQPLPDYERVAVGFPGMIREGHVLTAPHFVLKNGPGSEMDPDLMKKWTGFSLAETLGLRLGKPAKVANDADLQGAAVVTGNGFEFVITLGTGFGTASFYDGHLLPHFEFAHSPFRKGETYNDQLGERIRKQIGDERWSKRVHKAIEIFRDLVFFDTLYLGGGNARRLDRARLPDDVKIVDNTAGILGGIKLWDGTHVGL
jgi:polyphosphate glucokinase